MQRKLLQCLVFGTAFTLAALTAQSSNREPEKAAAQAKQHPGPNSPPASAERLEDGTYRVQESNGTTWLYRNTPFGWVKYRQKEEQKEKPMSAGAARKLWKAWREGDRVFFERRTPFGVSRWSKPLTELSPEEAEILGLLDPKPAKSSPGTGQNSTTSSDSKAAQEEEE